MMFSACVPRLWLFRGDTERRFGGDSNPWQTTQSPSSLHAIKKTGPEEHHEPAGLLPRATVGQV